MVESPADYHWSSYSINAQGLESRLCTPHSIYLALGQSKSKRLATYQALFRVHIDAQTISAIRKTTRTGMALGSLPINQNNSMDAVLLNQVQHRLGPA